VENRKNIRWTALAPHLQKIEFPAEVVVLGMYKITDNDELMAGN